MPPLCAVQPVWPFSVVRCPFPLSVSAGHLPVIQPPQPSPGVALPSHPAFLGLRANKASGLVPGVPLSQGAPPPRAPLGCGGIRIGRRSVASRAASRCPGPLGPPISLAPLSPPLPSPSPDPRPLPPPPFCPARGRVRPKSRHQTGVLACRPGCNSRARPIRFHAPWYDERELEAVRAGPRHPLDRRRADGRKVEGRARRDAGRPSRAADDLVHPRARARAAGARDRPRPGGDLPLVHLRLERQRRAAGRSAAGVRRHRRAHAGARSRRTSSGGSRRAPRRSSPSTTRESPRTWTRSSTSRAAAACAWSRTPRRASPRATAAGRSARSATPAASASTRRRT